MRVLVVDHYYQRFAQEWYAAHPDLAEATYGEQRGSFGTALFGETTFEVAALEALGHDAADVILNLHPAQETWASAHRLAPPSNVWVWRHRGRFLHLPTRRTDPRWEGRVLLAQIREFRPDVVHVQCMDVIDPALVPEIREYARLIVGQIAAPISIDRALAGYDLVLSSLPNFVARFRAAGLDSEWLPLAFEPSLVEAVGPQPRDIPVSFVGSLSRHHRSRMDLLEAVATRMPVSLWTAGSGEIGFGSRLRRDLHGPVWGADMYRVLASSRVTINTHIDIAEGFANNLRLYEATGMGALLITDEGSNLSTLFDVGRELVAYSSAQDCAEKIEHYVAHPAEASTIASAGQARTLRDHTWRNRMERLVEMIRERL